MLQLMEGGLQNNLVVCFGSFETMMIMHRQQNSYVDQPKLRGSGVVVTLVCEYPRDPEGI